MIHPSEPQPRYVTPGLENHLRPGIEVPEPGIYAGLDWIRCTGPDLYVDRVMTFLSERLAQEPDAYSGAAYFERGWLWDPGVQLSVGHSAAVLQVDVQGKRLSGLPGGERIRLLCDLLQLGLKPTRIDGALDYVGQGRQLCNAALASCDAGELCLLRQYKLEDGRTATGTPTTRLLRLGSRSSPVCARIYDKGLETGTSPCGYWERLEAEWKKCRASQVAQMLADADLAGTGKLAMLIIGAVDFRVETGRSELSRRSRVPWWAELCRDVGAVQPTLPVPISGRFDTWLIAFKRNVAPRLLQFAAAAGISVQQLVTELTKGCDAREQVDSVLRGFLTEHMKRSGAAEQVQR